MSSLAGPINSLDCGSCCSIESNESDNTLQNRITLASAVFWLAGITFHLFETYPVVLSGHDEIPMPPVEMGLFLLATLAGVWLVAPKAWTAAKRRSPDMNLLMCVAVIGAIALGEYFEAATVSFLFALSLYLEDWSVGRARNAVAALLELAPETVNIIQPDGSEKTVQASAVTVGEEFIVKAGERIALDARVSAGLSSVNQAPITGESAPVTKEPGDDVFAGTINGEGDLTLISTKPSSDTVLAKIIEMVGSAQNNQAHIEQWINKFARIYTPVVMAIAAIIAVVFPLVLAQPFTVWFYRALVLLVIACPCALVISTPVSIVAALTSAARSGVLIKGGAFVELPSRTTAVALDKTGTLTEGNPKVDQIFTGIGVNERSLLDIAAALEVRSTHPLGRAITDYYRTNVGEHIEAATDTTTVAGRGLEGTFARQSVWLGSQRFAQDKGVELEVLAAPAEAAYENGASLVCIGTGSKFLGAITLSDSIRADAKATISALRTSGVEEIVMLTGDNERSALRVASEVGIDHVRADLLPQDKLNAITELADSHEVVAMIGDGINDAPAMARAHYAIAMGAIGSDAAIETAEVALMSDDISKVPWLIKHSRSAMSIIRQNITFSLVAKAALALATGFGLASMWAAIAADVGVSLIVVTNALRLLRR